jgi:8-oxo-dGTP diphosphatase
MKEDGLFYVVQKAFIDKKGKVLVLNDPAEGLDFPGWKIQIGEADLIKSLKREVREESGLEIEVSEPFATWRNEFSTKHRYYGKEIYLVAFRCNYLSGEIKLSDEHNGYRWVSRNNYREVDDGTDYFQLLEKYFKSQ